MNTPYTYKISPFGLLPMIMETFQTLQTEALVLAHSGLSSSGFPFLMGLLGDLPRIIPPTTTILQMPEREKRHPLSEKSVTLKCSPKDDNTVQLLLSSR